MPVSVFSTVGLPAARRVERWESHNAAALIGLDVRVDGSLEATEVNVQLPVVRLARVRGSAHAVERTQAVTDVAARCGFTSTAYFSHVFRAHFGLRASDVRSRPRVVGS